jgi:hypothetical protein
LQKEWQDKLEKGLSMQIEKFCLIREILKEYPVHFVSGVNRLGKD